MTLTRKLTLTVAALFVVFMVGGLVLNLRAGTTYTYDPPWWSGAAAALFAS